jgi:hypothetical protein
MGKDTADKAFAFAQQCILIHEKFCQSLSVVCELDVRSHDQVCNIQDVAYITPNITLEQSTPLSSIWKITGSDLGAKVVYLD